MSRLRTATRHTTSRGRLNSHRDRAEFAVPVDAERAQFIGELGGRTAAENPRRRPTAIVAPYDDSGRRPTTPFAPRAFLQRRLLAEETQDPEGQPAGREHGADHPADEPGLEVCNLGAHAGDLRR